jgi:hypothetical protein
VKSFSLTSGYSELHILYNGCDAFACEFQIKIVEDDRTRILYWIFSERERQLVSPDDYPDVLL